MLIKIITMVFVAVFAICLIVPAKLISGEKVKKYVNGILTSVILFVVITNIVYKAWFNSFDLKYDLPLNLCDLSLVWILLTLLSKHQYFFELSYFWGVGGAIHALLTPDLISLEINFPLVLFLLNHGIVIAAALYLCLGLNMKPNRWSWLRVPAFTQLYLIVVGLVNLILNSNYSYLGHKPQHPSVMDYFGHWPIYIIWLEVFGLLTMSLLFIPFWMSRWIKKIEDSKDL